MAGVLAVVVAAIATVVALDSLSYLLSVGAYYLFADFDYCLKFDSVDGFHCYLSTRVYCLPQRVDWRSFYLVGELSLRLSSC